MNPEIAIHIVPIALDIGKALLVAGGIIVVLFVCVLISPHA